MRSQHLRSEKTEEESGGADAHVVATRAQAVEDIMAAAAERRLLGEAVDDEGLLKAHPDLMPELATELLAARQIRAARLFAERMGPIETKLHAGLPGEIDNHLDVLAASRLHAVEAAVVGIPGYALVREIPGGGQASVYEAVQERTQRRVAVKVLPGGPFVNSRRRVRFGREADLLAALDHANIVDVIDRGRTNDGSSFFVMRFVDGKPLDQYVMQLEGSAGNVVGRKSSVDDPRPVLQLFAKIALATGEAHRRGIVHRDLKPSNILVDRNGEPHLLDFGLACRFGPKGPLTYDPTITNSGQILGSLPWTSPEQAAGDSSNADARSDVYAIGVMLYQALAGEYPYNVTGRVNDVLNNIQHAVPAPLSSRDRIWTGIGKAAIDTVVLTALAKDPDARYPDAGALAADLQNCISGRETIARRADFPHKIAARRLLSARHVTAATAAAAGILIFGVLFTRIRSNSPSLVRGERTTQLVANLPSFRNSIGMRMRCVPPGRFNMGTASFAHGYQGTELQHEVEIRRPFYLSSTELTRGQYRAIMGDDSIDPAIGRSADDDLLPITGVTWNDAMEFCRRLNEREQGSYRLPSEAEWEYACRAGSSQIYGGSGLLPQLDKLAWHAGNAGGATVAVTVATRRPNVWGFFDMLGNAREWCADPWSPAYEPAKVQMEELRRVVKGGSIISPAVDCRPAGRIAVRKTEAISDVGFRVACDEMPPPP